jgi:isopenicillin N synthase-like dioxygenase
VGPSTVPSVQLVPTVDLEPWHSGDLAGRAEVARQFDEACRSIGFLQVVGHGVPDGVIDEMGRATAEFFALPLEEKRRCVPPDPTINRGYAASGTEALAYSIGMQAQPDLFEAFNIGEDAVDDSDPYYAAERHRLFAPNIWPDRPAALRSALVAYFAAVRAVALTLTEVFAPALGLPDGWFRPFVDRSTTTMRVNNYERRPDDDEPRTGQQRMGAHTDYGVVTVLYADQVPGLQIVGPDGGWLDVVPDRGAFLVNLGDLTAEWTNDNWRSTLHRVVPPPAGSDPVRRRSVAFFLDANWDARIECVPTCTDADNPPKYAPVHAGEHLMAKLLGPRTLRPSEAMDTAGDRFR